MINVFLLLGSNLGDRKFFLNKAIENIELTISPVEKSSSLYETAAWGTTGQPDYLNQVIIVKTDLSAREVLARVLAIELSLGRVREAKWDSRTIDIDILFYGADVINENDLEVPHPRLHLRRFTLEPLAEIAADFLHPVLRKTLLDLKNELRDNLVVKKL